MRCGIIAIFCTCDDCGCSSRRRNNATHHAAGKGSYIHAIDFSTMLDSQSIPRSAPSHACDTLNQNCCLGTLQHPPQFLPGVTDLMGRGDVSRAVLGLCLAPCLLLAFHGHAETIPAGATLEVRLEQPISSYSTPKGKQVSCLLIAPVGQDGKVLLPMGVTLKGSVVAVRKVGLGFVHETAQIDLVLQTLVLADGTSVPLHSELTQVENARESVDKEGRIQGIRSTSTISHRASGTVGMLALGDPIAAVFTVAASSAVLRFSEPEILLPAGTELTAKLTSPIEIPAQRIHPTPPLTSTVAEATQLRDLIRDMPFRTYTESSNVPSDLTNLMFIGNSDAIERAFTASGWEPVDELNAQTTYSTVRSIAENQGYRRAPMSVLLLNGVPPKYAYAKTLNTFSKRHHLRIFSTDATWQGEPVWNSSSTHDTGIGFSKKNKTFIHLIDSNIDNERAKVINDLLLTGCVTAVQMVSRPWVPRDAKNGTDESLITDGKIAVLQFNNCNQPNDDYSDDQPVPLPVHGNALDKSTRQTVLTVRNNILRDNIAVTAYSGIRYATQSKEKKESEKAARVVNVSGQEFDVEQGFHANEAYAASASTPIANPKQRRRASTACYRRRLVYVLSGQYGATSASERFSYLPDGRKMKTSVPLFPGSVLLVILIRPPCFSTSRFATHRPMPVPCFSLVVKNGSKIRVRCSASMPQPSSRTKISVPGLFPSVASRVSMESDPLGAIASMELAMMLENTCNSSPRLVLNG
jgi:hypothetical protein